VHKRLVDDGKGGTSARLPSKKVPELVCNICLTKMKKISCDLWRIHDDREHQVMDWIGEASQ